MFRFRERYSILIEIARVNRNGKKKKERNIQNSSIFLLFLIFHESVEKENPRKEKLYRPLSKYMYWTHRIFSIIDNRYAMIAEIAGYAVLSPHRAHVNACQRVYLSSVMILVTFLWNATIDGSISLLPEVAPGRPCFTIFLR